ncbi:uncharacterized protein MELLADRAFT_70793 [Melampsora larici-populina 98AG31]|uniref:Uncharacterized protein n=1 Tax=Melampsora larici-populina (strain 98AG31 / pathotype 3-4-7) TaxID=747676 RepID=F4R7Y2_MELLP|nr:uncharacterized protein MELLADRAFT_70793 [Melampsora larici-populina 98AG31]EGG11710.1 hypothetical protein MELLADRAFT_70793 [Melampsora larici-populina 98AG31]
MLTPKLVEYISPYVPIQVITVISVLGLTFERIVFPKFQQVYANASLDPNTLLPFIISMIVLYLSMISIYHTIKATARLVWFGIKWSILIVGLWFLLGFANQFGHQHSNHSNQTLSWWSDSNHWNWLNFYKSNPSTLNPLKLFILQSLPNLLDPMSFFESVFSFAQPASTSSDSNSNSNSDTFFNFPKTNSKKKTSSKSSSSNNNNNDKINQVSEKMKQFVVQNVKEPLVMMLKEIKSKNDQNGKGSKTRNR